MSIIYWQSEIIASPIASQDVKAPTIAALDNDGFVLAWTSGAAGASSVVGQIFDPRAGFVGAGFTTPSTPGTDFGASIVGTGGGTFALGWETNAGSSATPNYNIDVQQYTAAGLFTGAVETPFAFSASGPDTYNETGCSLSWNGQEAFITYADSSGELQTGYFFQGTFGGTLIYSKPSAVITGAQTTFIANGDLISASVVTVSGVHSIYAGDSADFVKIDTSTATTVTHPDVAGYTGGYVVVWQAQNETLNSDHDGYCIEGQLFDQFGNEVHGTFQINTTTAGDQTAPSVIGLADGGFMVAWQGTDASGHQSIYLQAYDSSGARNGTETYVGAVYGTDHISPVMTLLDDGRVAVAWELQDDVASQIRVQIVDPRDGLVNGTADADTLLGGDNADQVNGLAGDDSLWGGANADSLNGGDGNDTLDGGTGPDQMSGGAGNDLYYVDNVDDDIFETSTTGHDKAIVTVNGYTLADWVEVMQLKGGASAATGNDQDNHINAGRTGAELWGMGGADTLHGSIGDDTLHGGAGADIMQGKGGADTFAFDLVSDSTPDARDLIRGFSLADGDRIDLSAIDADEGQVGDQAFHYIGVHAFTHTAGELNAHYNAGTHVTVISGDTDGDGVANFQFAIKGDLTGVLDGDSFAL